MLKKFLSDIAFIQVLNLLVKPVWILIIDRAVQNSLSQEVYGEYFALYNFSLLFFIVLDLGITSFNATQVSKNTKRFKRQFGNLLGLKMLLSALYLFLVFTLGGLMGYDSQAFALLMLICMFQIISSFNQYFRSSISAFQFFRSDGVFMVMDRIIAIGLCAVLLWGGLEGWSINIERFVYAQLIGVGLVSFSLLLFIYYRLGRLRISFSFKKVFPMLKKTWPYGLLIALMGLYNYLDGVMLEKLSPAGAEDAGIYAMGYRLYFALFMFAQIFSNVLLPMYGKYEKEIRRIRALSSYAAKLLLLVAVSAALCSWVYQDELIQWLYPERYSMEASRAFGLLMFGFIGSVLILVYGTLLTAKEKLKSLNWAAAFTLLLNLILNFTLIPEYGPKGAAIATLISQLLFGLSCAFLSFKVLRIRAAWNPIIRGIVALLVLFVGIAFSRQYVASTGVHLVMITLTILITAYLIKLFDSKSLNSNP